MALQYRAQAVHYQAHWPDAQRSVIVARPGTVAQDAGRLWLDRRADTIQLLDIALLAAFRGQGIGTRCLQTLMQQADTGGRTLTVYVGPATRRGLCTTGWASCRSGHRRACTSAWLGGGW